MNVDAAEESSHKTRPPSLPRATQENAAAQWQDDKQWNRIFGLEFVSLGCSCVSSVSVISHGPEVLIDSRTNWFYSDAQRSSDVWQTTTRTTRSSVQILYLNLSQNIKTNWKYILTRTLINSEKKKRVVLISDNIFISTSRIQSWFSSDDFSFCLFPYEIYVRMITANQSDFITWLDINQV